VNLALKLLYTIPEHFNCWSAVDYDPGEVSAISPVTMASLLPSVILNTWARSTT